MVTPNDFDHRFEIKTNKLKLKKLQNWSNDRFSFTDSKVWTIWTAQLKLNKQYSREVLLRRFHVIAIAQDFSLSVPFGYHNDGGERGKYY